MYYDGTGTSNMAVVIEAAGQGNTVTAVTPSNTYWMRTGYTPLSNESLFTWDNWTPTNLDCPWTMSAPTAPATKVITHMPPRYMWGQALILGNGSSAYSGGTCACPGPPPRVPFVMASPPPCTFDCTGILGYCGEVSIQSTALMYGNWIHTEHAFQAGGIANNNAAAAHPRNAMVTVLWQNWATANSNPPTSYASGAPDGSVPGMTMLIGQTENFALAADFLGLTVDSWNDKNDPGGQGDAFYNTWMKVQ